MADAMESEDEIKLKINVAVIGSTKTENQAMINFLLNAKNCKEKA